MHSLARCPSLEICSISFVSGVFICRDCFGWIHHIMHYLVRFLLYSQAVLGYEGLAGSAHQFAPNLTEFDQVAKAGWPFYQLHSQSFFVQFSVCFKDLRCVPLKPGKVSGKQNHGSLCNVTSASFGQVLSRTSELRLKTCSKNTTVGVQINFRTLLLSGIGALPKVSLSPEDDDWMPYLDC